MAVEYAAETRIQLCNKLKSTIYMVIYAAFPKSHHRSLIKLERTIKLLETSPLLLRKQSSNLLDVFTPKRDHEASHRRIYA